MTPAELKYHVSSGTDSHFFDRSSMRFFGDTMKNYGVRSATVKVYDNHHAPFHGGGPDHVKSVECWELYRRRPVKHGLQSSAYFDKTTYSRIYPGKGGVTMKKSKSQITAENIMKHGANLQRIFNLDGDPVALCKKLRRLELDAEKVTTAMCNDSTLDPDDADAQLERILAKVDKLINFTRAGVPVFINRDPRGYALKIRDSYVHEHSVDIHRDFGGYGILAPDYSE